MGGVRFSLLAGTALVGATFAATTVRAADYPQPQPQPQIVYQPQPVPIPMPAPLPQVQEFEGWYLRGDIGYSIMKATELQYIKNPANPPNNFAFENTALSDSYFFGLGVGYQFNDMFRFDVTGEYRFKTSVFAIGSYTFGGGTFLDIYNGSVQSWLFLANAYMDLGTWWCITPFVGVGVGGAYNTLSLSDFATNAGRGFSDDKAELDLAWALHAGLSYAVTQNFKVELAYRYLSMGSAMTSIKCVGGCIPDSFKLTDLTASEFKLAMRWSLYDSTPSQLVYSPPPPAYTPPPVYAQPQYMPAPVYAPAPVYSPPPVYAPAPVYAPPPQPVYQQPLVRKG